MIFFIYIYKGGKRLLRLICRFNWIITYLKFRLNNVIIPSDFISNGVPITAINLKSKVLIGSSFTMNNGMYHNMIGRQQPCFFIVKEKAELIIGNNVGISSAAIVCWSKITIEDNVRIGGGTVIYDTDFHSLNSELRITNKETIEDIKTAPVLIRENAFIGANCTILKGVVIGRNSIVGASSVITKSIPDNELWAGNPAKFIKSLV